MADSPWDPGVVQRAVAERVAPQIGVEAWVIDDTGFPKDGTHSPGVKRQYSGTLGKIGNCQIAVSVHAVSQRGTLPLDWALYLPEEWCKDAERRRKAKIPEDVAFQTKPQLAAGLIERAATWKVPRGPVLGDEAYGNNCQLRARLHDADIEYVLSVNADALVYDADTVFAVPERRPGSRGPAPSALVADRRPRQVADLAASLHDTDFQTLVYRTRDGQDISSRFALLRVICAHPFDRDRQAPREEWLIIEWPEGAEQPSDYWISNLPPDTPPERLARLARLRWMIELDYRQLKGELGLDHYEGRSYPGFHHHCAIVTAAHGFLGACALPVGRVNAGYSPDRPSVLAFAPHTTVSDVCAKNTLRSSASQRRQGRRCAARCARPWRAALDRAASLRWMAIEVARTRNPPDSRHFLVTEVLVSVPHEDRPSSNHVRRGRP
ncbi:MAG: IS701 family transposase [Solirubrobacteraceae bacterium]